MYDLNVKHKIKKRTQSSIGSPVQWIDTNQITLLLLLLIGVVSVLETVRSSNDLGHPLCHNLSGGDWLINYTIFRLRSLQTIIKVSSYDNWSSSAW